MENLSSKEFILYFLIILSCEGYSQDKNSVIISIEDIKIGNVKVFQKVTDRHYRYTNKKVFIKSLGTPDRMEVRKDELMETEIIRVSYGKSFMEFYDHSFGGGVSRDDYSLYRVDIRDDKLWLSYNKELLKVGVKSEFFYKQIGEKNIVEVKLRRGLLDEISEYVMKIEFIDDKVSNVVAIFD